MALGLLALSLVATSCGGKKEGETNEVSLKEKHLTAADGESGLAEAGKPVRGGTLKYGVEADTASYCLPEAQLAISGMLVVRALYDTLTVPNEKGEYVPYLAQKLDHNATYDEWTITLRKGIKFSDGSDLTAEVVKNNLDAYRGKYPGRSSLLFTFVLSNIDTVEVTGPLTVKVTTKKPWVAFPAYLFSSSRLGIVGQAQLDSDNCDKKLIGTGPFQLVSWTENSKLVAKRNPNYWQIAPDGKPYPYADGIEFRPITDGQVRNQALQAGDINLMHTTNSMDIANKLWKLREDGKINMYVSEEQAEVAFLQLNATKPPFNDVRMRKAMAMAANREQINEIVNSGLNTIANGPISPGSLGFVKDTGFPAYNQKAARALVQEYVGEGHKSEFTLSSTPDPAVKQLVQLVQTRAKAIGVTVKIRYRDQAALINDAIGRDFQAMTFRNYPGGDPDSLYVWFHSGGANPEGYASNPVNFAGFADKVVDKALDDGRSEPDPTKREKIYETLDKQMGSQVYGLWTWFTPWAIAESSNVHGILGPPLPGEDASKPGPATTDDPARKPSLGLAVGHSLIGLWISK
ncbi:MAG: ABC transporter substrate-binding protein [Acidimicrobiales bacterium]|nr:ABC transporter substrate-binding protein [Acidimicrobiales bacterium]